MTAEDAAVRSMYALERIAEALDVPESAAPDSTGDPAPTAGVGGWYDPPPEPLPYENDAIQVVLTAAIQPAFKAWLHSRGLYANRFSKREGDLSTYIIGIN